MSPINKLFKGRADSRASTIRGYSTMNSLPKVRVSELEKGIKNYGLRKASRHDDLSPLRGQSKQKSKKSKSKSTSGSYKIEIRHHQFLIFSFDLMRGTYTIHGLFSIALSESGFP